MEIENLVDSANEALYQSVKKQLDIVLEENPDWRVDFWMSLISGNSAIIKYCPTDFPNAAFALELLHIETQIHGFKRVLEGISLNKKIQEKVPTIIQCLYYHFQNHKIAAKFITLGYPHEQLFPKYEAESTIKYLESQLKEKSRSVTSISIDYLALIEPMLYISDLKKAHLKKGFDEYEHGNYKHIFKSIDEIMNLWSKDASYDAEKYMIQFLEKAGVTEAWFSYTNNGINNDDFPVCGFFVDHTFTLDDIEKIYGK